MQRRVRPLKVVIASEDSDDQMIHSTASPEEKKNADYVRFINSINVDEHIPREFLKNIFGSSLYKGTMVKLTWTGACKSEEPVHAFRIMLEEIPKCVPAHTGSIDGIAQ